MQEIVGIKFSSDSKVYYFSPNGVKYNVGDYVIVDSINGYEFSFVAIENTMIEDNEIVDTLKPVIRLATEQDIKRVEKNKENAKEAFIVVENMIKSAKLEMKLLEVAYTFDLSKLLITFSADDRVDFRDLVKDLASKFKTRIELRQVGARDEAKLVGGLGPCGRETCCGSFLNNFCKVTIKMAKNQNLSLNPTKINGLCGKLMCCLSYENDVYTDAINEMPTINQTVETAEGNGTVSYNNLLKKLVTVKFIDKDNNISYKEFPLSDIKFNKNGEPKVEKNN